MRGSQEELVVKSTKKRTRGGTQVPPPHEEKVLSGFQNIDCAGDGRWERAPACGS